MSDIPTARRMLEALARTLPSRDARTITQAVALMGRTYTGRARGVRVRKTKWMTNQVVNLARTTAKTQTEIAVHVGLRNSGRVSEILAANRVERPLLPA